MQGLCNHTAAAGAMLHMRLYMGFWDCLFALVLAWGFGVQSCVCRSDVARSNVSMEPHTDAVITRDCV